MRIARTTRLRPAALLGDDASAMPETETTALPLILLLMVKDEEKGIERPLQSAAAIGIREAMLVDTGSTDATIPRAFALAEGLGIALSVDTIPWPGSFADARNACLALAAQAYPHRHALFLDADDEVVREGGDAAPWAFAPARAHAVTMRLGADSWPMARLIALRAPLPRYHGAVHEVLDVAAVGTLPAAGLTVRHHAGKPSRERWKRDEVLLREEVATTKSPRAVFYLAQTIECLADGNDAFLREALGLYEARAKDLSHEEGFVAGLRAAGILERLLDLADGPTAKEALFILGRRLALHEAFPDRPEPLVDAAFAYLRAARWRLAYTFAKMAQACTPRPDALFLRRTAQWNETYDILSRACLHVPGKLAEGLALTREAAQAMGPGVAAFDWPRHNLPLYRKRLHIETPFPEEDPAFVGGSGAPPSP